MARRKEISYQKQGAAKASQLALDRKSGKKRSALLAQAVAEQEKEAKKTNKPDKSTAQAIVLSNYSPNAIAILKNVGMRFCSQATAEMKYFAFYECVHALFPGQYQEEELFFPDIAKWRKYSLPDNNWKFPDLSVNGPLLQGELYRRVKKAYDEVTSSEIKKCKRLQYSEAQQYGPMESVRRSAKVLLNYNMKFVMTHPTMSLNDAVAHVKNVVKNKVKYEKDFDIFAESYFVSFKKETAIKQMEEALIGQIPKKGHENVYHFESEPKAQKAMKFFLETYGVDVRGVKGPDILPVFQSWYTKSKAEYPHLNFDQVLSIKKKRVKPLTETMVTVPKLSVVIVDGQQINAETVEEENNPEVTEESNTLTNTETEENIAEKATEETEKTKNPKLRIQIKNPASNTAASTTTSPAAEEDQSKGFWQVDSLHTTEDKIKCTVGWDCSEFAIVTFKSNHAEPILWSGCEKCTAEAFNEKALKDMMEDFSAGQQAAAAMEVKDTTIPATSLFSVKGAIEPLPQNLKDILYKDWDESRITKNPLNIGGNDADSRAFVDGEDIYAPPTNNNVPSLTEGDENDSEEGDESDLEEGEIRESPPKKKRFLFIGANRQKLLDEKKRKKTQQENAQASTQQKKEPVALSYKNMKDWPKEVFDKWVMEQRLFYVDVKSFVDKVQMYAIVGIVNPKQEGNVEALTLSSEACFAMACLGMIPNIKKKEQVAKFVAIWIPDVFVPEFNLYMEKFYNINTLRELHLSRDVVLGSHMDQKSKPRIEAACEKFIETLTKAAKMAIPN